MLRQINFYSICIAFGLSVLLILAGSRYTDNTIYRPYIENRRNTRNFLKTEDNDDIPFQPIPTNSVDGSTNIDLILENTRLKIKSSLANYNFSRTDGKDTLEDLLMESGGQPLRSLIISTWRSGTTFLGEILNAIPGNYYHYEPLLSYKIVQIRGPPLADNALNLIKNMLKCDYRDMQSYFDYGEEHLHQFSHNTRLWGYCKQDKKLCIDPEFTSKFCSLFPFQSMKVVRVRLRLIEDFLKDEKLRLKVIYLVRDPRGVMQSRQHRDFCQPAPDCWRPELLCADMVNDYSAALMFAKKYPDKFVVVRYEDLAMNLNVTSHRLLKFLGLSITPSVDEFLQSHTNVQMGGVSSTFRVSRDVPFRWKSILDYNYVEEIQDECKEAMKHWGYCTAHNITHMESKDFNPLCDFDFHQ